MSDHLTISVSCSDGVPMDVIAALGQLFPKAVAQPSQPAATFVLRVPLPFTKPPATAAKPPVDCPHHDPKQHRDGKPPWCQMCGLTADFQRPVSSIQHR